MKKIVIFGEGAVGKTSIVLTSCFGHNFQDIEKLLPTKGVSIEKVDVGGLEKVNIWDCGGQEKYIQSHFSETGVQRIFSDVDVAIFVMDASRQETLSPVYADHFFKLLIDFNPDLEKVYIFINKMDIAPSNINDLIMQLTKTLLEKWGDGKFIEIVNCSVKFGSAKEKFVHILDAVMSRDPNFSKKREFFAGCLADFREIVDGNFILFHIPSGLTIANFIMDDHIQYISYANEVIKEIIESANGTEEKILYKNIDNCDCVFLYNNITKNIGMLTMTENDKYADFSEIGNGIKSHSTYKDLIKIFQS